MASYKLDLETPKRNVFVTQLKDHEEDEDSSNVNKYPIVQESSSKLVSTGIKTLQSTLLIQQRSKAERLQDQLENKRQEYQEKMLASRIKEERLRKRQQQIKEKVNKFDKFIKETEAKRRRALEKYHTENKLKEQKTKELEIHTEELRKLKQRQRQLQKRVEIYSTYEKYLMKVLEITPDDYIENSSDSMLLGIMMRFKTLNTTNHSLTEALSSKTDEVKIKQQLLQNIKQQYNQLVLVDSSELAILQHQLEDESQRNAQREHILQTSEEIYRNQSRTLGKAKLAVINIAEKCIKKHSKPLANMDVNEMLTLIGDFLREHDDICRMARKIDTPLLVDISTSETPNAQPSPKKDYTSKKLPKRIPKNATQSQEINSKERNSLMKLKTGVQNTT